jgi:hypothetical protein
MLAAPLVLSLAAKAQTPLAPLKPLISLARPAAEPESGYIVARPLDARQWSPSGWGLSATASGRSMDFSSVNGWAADPNARPGEMEAGLRWRGPTASALVGYAQPNYAAPVGDYPHGPQPRGLVGVAIVLRTR